MVAISQAEVHQARRRPRAGSDATATHAPFRFATRCPPLYSAAMLLFEPKLEVLLEELIRSGDRQRLFVAKIEIKT